MEPCHGMTLFHIFCQKTKSSPASPPQLQRFALRTWQRYTHWRMDTTPSRSSHKGVPRGGFPAHVPMPFVSLTNFSDAWRIEEGVAPNTRIRIAAAERCSVLVAFHLSPSDYSTSPAADRCCPNTEFLLLSNLPLKICASDWCSEKYRVLRLRDGWCIQAKGWQTSVRSRGSCHEHAFAGVQVRP